MNKKIIIKTAREELIPILWDGREEVINYDVTLTKPGAILNLVGLLIGNADKKLQINITVVHAAPNTTSEIILKGVLNDFARVEFNGLVKIDKGSKGTKTWLATHLLVLSDQAKGKATPSLEILENDIKAGHAATVGKVSEMEMFYLQSRGLSSQLAKKLIVQGFLSSILGKFPKVMQQKVNKYII